MRNGSIRLYNLARSDIKLLSFWLAAILLLDGRLSIRRVCCAGSMIRPQFVLFGDSLTQKACDPDGGWSAGLAHKYQRKVSFAAYDHT